MLRFRLSRPARAAAVLVACAGLFACGGGGGGGSTDTSEAARADDPMPAANAQMQAVLDELAALGAQPLNTLTVEQARSQPSPADAVVSLLAKQGRSTAPEPVGSVVDGVFPGPASILPLRVYTPAGTGPFPVILYIHGGGWVIADLDTYDSSARALTNAAGAIVVSVHYRQAPEARFPAAHDDTYAAYRWTLQYATALGGIPSKVAVVGESAGGNMAASITLRARADGVQAPVHQVLIYPVTDYAYDKPSQQQNRDAMPLNTASLAWFYDKYLPTPADGADPLFSVYRATDLSGLPSASVVTADIDPLRSEGRFYAERLAAAGVPVRYTNYPGVTHEFFGMGAVVDDAANAVASVGADLKAAFARTGN